MFPIIQKPFTWFAEQINWLGSIWWVTLVVNSLKQNPDAAYQGYMLTKNKIILMSLIPVISTWSFPYSNNHLNIRTTRQTFNNKYLTNSPRTLCAFPLGKTNLVYNFSNSFCSTSDTVMNVFENHFKFFEGLTETRTVNHTGSKLW